MWEFEKKALLTRAEYEILETAFFGADCKSVVNKNHYYDTDNLEMNRAGITCRIRETDGRFKAVIKTHKTDGGECSREDSFPADGAGNAITVNGRSYSYKGTLITFRKIKKYNEKISLMLDKNEYLGVTDFELEIEYCRGCKSSAEDLLGNISELLKKHGALQSGLPPGERAYSAVSKSARFFERYKSLQDCGKNLNIGKTPEEKESLVKFSTGMNSVQIRSLKDGLGRKILEEMRTENGALFCEFVYRKDSDTDKSSDKTESGFSSQSRRAYQIKYSNGRTLSYEYDENGRVTKFNDGNKNTTVYGYDPQGRLITESVNNIPINTVAYAENGDIISKNGMEFVYGASCLNSGQLISAGRFCIAYDNRGNPADYMGHILCFSDSGRMMSYDAYTYKYNDDGVRISKTIAGCVHEYDVSGGRILREGWRGNTLIPLYGGNGEMYGIEYNGEIFWFIKNIRGDVVSVTDDKGITLADYLYDAWGDCTVKNDKSGCKIASANPFRYKGLYYDRETDLYCLGGSYYDSFTGGFITADIRKEKP